MLGTHRRRSGCADSQRSDLGVAWAVPLTTTHPALGPAWCWPAGRRESMATSLLLRVRNPEWLQGHVGLRVQGLLRRHLPGARVERMPVGFSISGPGSGGRLCDRALAALRRLELDLQRIDPLRYALLGPVTTGTVHCLAPNGTVEMHAPSLPEAEAAGA